LAELIVFRRPKYHCIGKSRLRYTYAYVTKTVIVEQYTRLSSNSDGSSTVTRKKGELCIQKTLQIDSICAIFNGTSKSAAATLRLVCHRIHEQSIYKRNSVRTFASNDCPHLSCDSFNLIYSQRLQLFRITDTTGLHRHMAFYTKSCFSRKNRTRDRYGRTPIQSVCCGILTRRVIAQDSLLLLREDRKYELPDGKTRSDVVLPCSVLKTLL